MMEFQETKVSESLVMVDVMGRIVFMNHKSDLLDFISVNSNEITGEPFFEVFNITFEKYKELTNSTQSSATSGNIELMNNNKQLVNINYEAIAQLDGNNTLLGYDILLHVPINTAPALLDTSHVVDTDEMSYIEVDHEIIRNLMQNLDYLLSRIGGKFLSNHLELIINNTIHLNQWDMKLEHGELIIGTNVPTDAFEAIVTRGILFAIKVVGKNMTQTIVDQTLSQFSDDDLASMSELNIERLFEL